MKLVQITVSYLVERYGTKVPEFAKRNLGECIITLFPNLRDPSGKYGYVSVEKIGIHKTKYFHEL